jgi:hypothetical protein
VITYRERHAPKKKKNNLEFGFVSILVCVCLCVSLCVCVKEEVRQLKKNKGFLLKITQGQYGSFHSLAG